MVSVYVKPARLNFGGLKLKKGLNEVDSKALEAAAEKCPKGWLEALMKSGALKVVDARPASSAKQAKPAPKAPKPAK